MPPPMSIHYVGLEWKHFDLLDFKDLAFISDEDVFDF